MKEHTKEKFPHKIARTLYLDLHTSSETEHGNKKFPKKQLSKQSRLLLLVLALYLMGNAFSDIFVGVYLWKLKSDFTMISWFYVAEQLTMAITLWVAGKQVKEGNKMNALRAGIGVAALFYLLVLLLGPKAITYILPLGALQGVADGLFWLANNVVYFEVTDRDNRDRFNGWSGLLSSLSYMLAPWISGFLISKMTGTRGYQIIFTLSLVIFLASAATSFFLKKRKSLGAYDWLFGFRQFADSLGPWRRISLAMAAQGMREGVFGFAIGLLVYIVTKNEMKMGNYSLITSAIGLISYWIAGSLFKRKYRLWGSFIGILAIIIVIIPFYWQVSYSTLLFFGIGVGLFFPLYTIPITSVVFDVIGRNEESVDHRVEYVVLREMSLNSGRLFGTLMFIAGISWNQSHSIFTTLLLVIGSSPLAVWLLLRRWLRAPSSQNFQ